MYEKVIVDCKKYVSCYFNFVSKKELEKRNFLCINHLKYCENIKTKENHVNWLYQNYKKYKNIKSWSQKSFMKY